VAVHDLIEYQTSALHNAYILPIFLHGAETWSITKATEKKIDAFDQWCLRRILNITWSEHVTNYEVHRRTGQPLLLCGPDASSCLATWPGRTCHKIIPVLYRPLYRALQVTGDGVQVAQDTPGLGLRRAQNRTAWRTLTGTSSD